MLINVERARKVFKGQRDVPADLLITLTAINSLSLALDITNCLHSVSNHGNASQQRKPEVCAY